MTLRTSVKIWRERRRSSYCARASTRLKPEQVDLQLVGHHLSAVFRRGVRTYNFDTEQYRDKFVELYAGFGAEICEDPYP